MESRLDFYRRWHRLSKPYIHWQFQQFAPYLGRRVADVGCGLGNFTPWLLDRELYLGVDLDEELLRELESTYHQSPSVQALRLDLTDASFAQTMTRHRIDSLLCVNVLEHIENDRRAAENMVSSLPPDGHLCLLVPAFQCLFGTLDKLDGHFRRYTKKTLARLVSGLPIETLRAYYFNFIGAPGWFLKGRVLKQPTHTDDNFGLMNALLPLVRPLERLCPPPFGMSLIGIYRRR